VNRDLYVCKRDHCVRNTDHYVRKRDLCICKRDLYVCKRDVKETHTLSKEKCMYAKQSHLLSKETCLYVKETSAKKRVVLREVSKETFMHAKRPIFCQKRPVCMQKRRIQKSHVLREVSIERDITLN